jgi:hypothetical protein
MPDFSACPRIHLGDDASIRTFWADFDAYPRPVRITQDGIGEVNFLEAHARQLPGGDGYQLADHHVVGGRQGSPYVLTSSGYAPGLLEGIAEKYPLPTALSSILMRPVISIGINGTGEKDIAHHFHPVTAMRLLQGRKIWALRAPTDQECAANTGDCTDPFLVCDFYARPSAPMPACVQEPGDTILVPDGWYHGTCNNASWTVGWGGQGQLFRHTPPRCFHCRLGDGQLHYATTDEKVLTLHDAEALRAELPTGPALARGAHWRSRRTDARGPGLHSLGYAAQAPYMVCRSLFLNFLRMSMLAKEESRDLRMPECTLEQVAAEPSDGEAEVAGRLDRAGMAHFVLPLRGPPLELTLRHLASGESEAREVPLLHAAFWVGGALAEVRRGWSGDGGPGRGSAQEGDDASTPAVLLHCTVPMPGA